MFELVKCSVGLNYTLFYKNILDKNIEAEMSEILRICFNVLKEYARGLVFFRIYFCILIVCKIQ